MFLSKVTNSSFCVFKTYLYIVFCQKQEKIAFHHTLAIISSVNVAKYANLLLVRLVTYVNSRQD